MCQQDSAYDFLALLDIGVAHGRVRVEGCLFDDLIVARMPQYPPQVPKPL